MHITFIVLVCLLLLYKELDKR